MAMDVQGGAGGIKSDINITPLVDVVLVLLIIFMVAVPLLQMGYAVQVPPKVTTPAPPDNDQIIVRLDDQGHAFINKTQVGANEFQAALSRVLTGRQSKVVFFAADGELPYDKVATFMDMVRDAGAQNLGIVFDDLRPTAVPTR